VASNPCHACSFTWPLGQQVRKERSLALLDVDRQVIVIRIVYDGPALSGKTTTLRALAGSLGRELFSGDEAEGRTLYCDWLDYTGGRFDGYPIRCQVVSVPGQRLLRERRRRLLAEADAVVFVAEGSRPGLIASARMLLSLNQMLHEGIQPRPGTVVQVNKRDAVDALSMGEVRAALAVGDGFAITESVATAGAGIRETFVLAVRLALDRVRELIGRSALPKGRPDVDSGAALLDALRSDERDAPLRAGTSAASSLAVAPVALREALAAEGSAPGPTASIPRRVSTESSPPLLPSSAIPGGMIWPPVDGRIVLHEAVASAPPIELLADGSWMAVSGEEWCLYSHSADECADVDGSRSKLIDWARWHVGCDKWLSPRRCILAADAGGGAWRLWQVVGAERTLRLALRQVLSRADPEDVARGLVELSHALAAAVSACAQRGLSCSVDNVGYVESGLAYVGMAPAAGALTGHLAATSGPTFEEKLRAEFGPTIVQVMSGSDRDVPRVLHHLTIAAAAAGQTRIGEVVAALLIGN
jgi:signal recognition particle receptor subunit beta